MAIIEFTKAGPAEWDLSQCKCSSDFFFFDSLLDYLSRYDPLNHDNEQGAAAVLELARGNKENAESIVLGSGISLKLASEIYSSK